MKELIEIRPNVFEPLERKNIEKNGEHAGFFHSLGRAIQGEEVANSFITANRKSDASKSW